MSMMQTVLSGVFTADTPELKYTPTGVAILKFRVMAEKYMGGKGQNARYKTITCRVTVWGDKAEFIHPLLLAYINPNKDGAKPGVGCPVTIFSKDVIDYWSFVDEKATAEGVMQDAEGGNNGNQRGEQRGENSRKYDKIVTSAVLEVTAYEVLIHARLPEGAYKHAVTGAQSRAAGGSDDEDVSDIPF